MSISISVVLLKLLLRLERAKSLSESLGNIQKEGLYSAFGHTAP